MYYFANLPTKASGDTIVAKNIKDNILVEAVYDSDSRATICEISTVTPEALAKDIADAIRIARNVGFQQGLASIRAALSGSV